MVAASSRWVLLAAGLLLAPVAHATAQRTFVHSAPVGDDANTAFNCSLSKPCRSFSAALGLTLAGGEIVVLDSAGYGPVTITQAVTIVAPAGVYAGITVPASGTGVKVQAGATDTVTLRGLTITTASNQTLGIAFTSGKSLLIDRAVISGFGKGVAQYGAGNLTVRDSAISEGVTGIFIATNLGTGGLAEFTVDRCNIRNMSGQGISAEEGAIGYVRDTRLAQFHDPGIGGGYYGVAIGVYALVVAGAATAVTLDGALMSTNDKGVYVDSFNGRTATVRVVRSVASGNGMGFQVEPTSVGASFRSLNNSLDDGNTTPSSPRTTLTPY